MEKLCGIILSNPSIIYVKNFIVDDDPDDTPETDSPDRQNSSDEESRIQGSGISEMQNTENPVSCAKENRSLELDKIDEIKNNIIKTDMGNDLPKIRGCQASYRNIYPQNGFERRA